VAWHTTKVCGWGANTHFFFLWEPSSRHMPHNTCAYRVINHASLVGRQIITLTHLPILSFIIIPSTNKAKPHVLLAYNIYLHVFLDLVSPSPKEKPQQSIGLGPPLVMPPVVQTQSFSFQHQSSFTSIQILSHSTYR
jgi:hypothetical protein